MSRKPPFSCITTSLRAICRNVAACESQIRRFETVSYVDGVRVEQIKRTMNLHDQRCYQLRCQLANEQNQKNNTVARGILVYFPFCCVTGWLGSRVDIALDSGAEGPGFKSQPRRCRVTVLGKLFTSTVPLKGCGGNCRPGGK